jgi:hypothetical protein
MKKLLLLAALLGVGASAFAQGTIRFANTGSPTGFDFRLWTNSPAGTASNLMSGAGRYRIGLYGSADANATSNSLTLIATTLNTPVAGIFSGGDPYVLPNGYAALTPFRFQLRAWSVAGGASYEEAIGNPDLLNTAIGFSDLGLVTLGGGAVQQAPLFGTNPGQLSHGFAIKPVPEPSSIALGLLGLGAIAMFRRKK